MSDPPRILIAGIGNVFLGDDAFGVHVARRLARHPFPTGVRVADFGIRGIDLVYALLDEPDLAILIDAVPRGDAPGTLYLIEPQIASDAPPFMEGHAMDPARVLAMAQSMGPRRGRVLVVGCEPTPIDPSLDMQMDLSPAVKNAIEPAAQRVISLVTRFLENPTSLEVADVDDKIEPVDAAAQTCP